MAAGLPDSRDHTRPLSPATEPLNCDNPVWRVCCCDQLGEVLASKMWVQVTTYLLPIE